MLKLTEYLDRYPRQLSGGQRQRVAMGRALVREPMAFLLDEPLSNLDAQLRVQMRAELRDLHQRLKATMVYVTHDQIEAMTLADRIVVMNNGNIEQIGTPDEVYDNPANTFVASFIGSPAMNMLKGKLKRNNGKVWIDLYGGGRIELPSNQTGEDGMQILLGVRPEDFFLTTEKDGLELPIDMIEMTGRELEIFGQCAGKQLCVLLRDRQKVKAGEIVWIKPNVEHSHVFQADTGMALLKT
jgi:multiple sugar transport system ATP-binding protein